MNYSIIFTEISFSPETSILLQIIQIIHITFGIIPESDSEGRAVCQFWLQGGKHNVTPTDKITFRRESPCLCPARAGGAGPGPPPERPPRSAPALCRAGRRSGPRSPSGVPPPLRCASFFFSRRHLSTR